MDMFNNEKRLFGAAALMFLILTLFVAVLPAFNNQNMVKPLPLEEPLSEEAIRGKAIYIANGCVACHTQQVRNVAMDNVWGRRPSLAADYARNTRTDFFRNTATLMGTGRTGPDLTDLGNRQPSLDWNLVHLYNPRIVVKQSVMPAYPFLFKLKKNISCGDALVNIPELFMEGKSGKIVATQDALDLVAYLQSLKQAGLPKGAVPSEFLYGSSDSQSSRAAEGAKTAIDGKALYTANCISCHQENGMGLPGAFPALKGSPVVTGENLELYVDIIMNGYDARPEYGTMPGIGAVRKWTEKEVAAIINYERSSWGNHASKVTEKNIKEILDKVNGSKSLTP